MCRRSNAIFFMLLRNSASKASPTTGTEPTAVSNSVFAIIRAINRLGAPRRRASPIRQVETRLKMRSPDRDEADERIEADPEVRPGQDELTVHQPCQRL